MVIAEIVTLLLYAISIVFLPEYFGAFLQFIRQLSPSPKYCVQLFRPFVRCLRPFCLEGSNYCGSQCIPIVCNKICQEQDLPCSFKQTTVIYLGVGCTTIYVAC